MNRRQIRQSMRREQFFDWPESRWSQAFLWLLGVSASVLLIYQLSRGVLGRIIEASASAHIIGPW